MHVVHLNGVALLPGVDYVVGDSVISFMSPPAAGSDIVFTEVINANTGATHMTRLTGNGVNFLFKLETNFAQRVKLSELFDTAIKYKDIPAVTDAINKLRVVLELVKEDDIIR